MSIRVPVTIELKDEAQLGKIAEMVEGDAPPANKADAFVNELITQVLAGAMVLPAEAVDRILDIDPDMDDAEKIIEAIEAGSGISGGDMMIRWPNDPALTQPLNDRAHTQGVPVQQLIRDTMDQFVALGYFYDIGVDMRTIFLNRDDEKEVIKLLGNKDFTSADIMAAIRKSGGPRPEAPEEEDGDQETKEAVDEDIFEPAVS